VETEFKYDEILEFFTNIEMNKDNVMDVMEFVHYKSALDTITNIIETSKETTDTGYLAVNYVHMVKKLEDIIKKISDKYIVKPIH